MAYCKKEQTNKLASYLVLVMAEMVIQPVSGYSLVSFCQFFFTHRNLYIFVFIYATLVQSESS